MLDTYSNLTDTPIGQIRLVQQLNYLLPIEPPDQLFPICKIFAHDFIYDLYRNWALAEKKKANPCIPISFVEENLSREFVEYNFPFPHIGEKYETALIFSRCSYSICGRILFVFTMAMCTTTTSGSKKKLLPFPIIRKQSSYFLSIYQ